jgi:hypothetical protein
VLFVACSSEPSDGAGDNVYVSNVHRFGHASGTLSERVETKQGVVAAAIVTADGASRTILGTARADGSIAIPGVPHGPYILELKVPSLDVPTGPPALIRLPIDSARSVRLGSNYWARKDAVALTPNTKFALSVSTKEDFVRGDQFSWIGLRSYFYRTAEYDPDLGSGEGHANVPAESSTTSSGWTIDGSALVARYGSEASGLPSAAAGDDLTLIQERRETVERDGNRFDAWTKFTKRQVVGVLTVADATFSNDTTNTITGTLAAPTTEALTIEFRGSSFAKIREAAGYPVGIRATAAVSMSQEAGSGPEVFASIAPPCWSLTAVGTVNPVVPECYPPASYECPDPACGGTCNPSTDGYRDPGDVSYSFDAPRVYATGMREFYQVSYGYFLPWKHPDTGDMVTLSASAVAYRAKSGSSASFSLELGPVRNLRIEGKPLSWDANTGGIGTTPTFTFDAPTVGTPEYYELVVMELLPDLGSEVDSPRDATMVARIFTRATSVQIPEGVLRGKRYYYVRAYAVRDRRDFAEPYVTKSDASFTTGVFSPVFTP